MYFFSTGIFCILFIYHLFVWLGRKNELNNLAFAVLSLIYGVTITLCRITILFEQKTIQHLIPIFMTMILSVTLPFLGYILLKQKVLKKFFFYSSSSVICFSVFMIIHFFIWNINPLLVQIYYSYIAIWPFTGTILVIKHFISNRQYKDKESVIFLAGYITTLLSMVAQLIFIIPVIGFPSSFTIFQSLPLLIVMIVLANLSSAKFNREYRDLLSLKRSLEKKVEERTEELREAHRQKINFFINFAHETKTPLLLIRNYLEKHIKQSGETFNLNIIRENIKALTCNIVNLLDMEKMDQNRPLYDHNQIIDAGDFMDRKISLFEIPVKRAGMEIHKELLKGCLVRINYFALDRIMNNLIENAIKYNSSPGRITISMTTGNEGVKIMISDTGTGIQEDELPRIFQPYYQVRSNKSGSGGIGIGLSIVKKIVDSAGGKIEVESEIDKGTTFSILFPVVQPGEVCQVIATNLSLPVIPPIQIELQKEHFVTGKKIVFIIDDNKAHLAFLQSSLLADYNVYYALNGNDALKKIHLVPLPNIILCDIMMDGMDGYHFHRQLISEEKFRNIPFIFLTALTNEEEKIKGLHSGAVDFISKPYMMEELQAKIYSLLSWQEEQINYNQTRLENRIIKAIREESPTMDIFDNIKNNCRKYKISVREEEILLLLVQGFEHKEICYKLKISINTLKTHVKNIYEKCSVQNKVELLNKINDHR